MKKSITTLALALSLVVSSQAQECEKGRGEGGKPAPNAKLISRSVEGDTQTCKWQVPVSSPDTNNEFSVRYQLNLARLATSYDRNHQELVGLRSFMDEILADKHKHIKRIEVVGYASPDGTKAINDKLALARATDCAKYIRKEYPGMTLPCTTQGIAEPWTATKEAVENSSIPMKNEVLTCVMSDASLAEKEAKLRGMSSAWSYMAENILPTMRCVNIHVIYTATKEVVTSCPAGKQKPKQRAPMPEEIIVQQNYFVIVEPRQREIMAFENPASAPLDYVGARDRREKRVRMKRIKMKEEMRGRKYLFKNKR